MNNQVAQYAGTRAARSAGASRTEDFESTSDPIPVLIRVPSLSTSRGRAAVHTAARPRVRRRLKSEVRVAAATLMIAMPLSWGMFSLVGWGPGPAASQAREVSALQASNFHPSPIAEHADEPRATISLRTIDMPSISPTAPPAEEIEAPVAVPAGYLVPDEAPEEMTSDAGH